MKSIKAHITFLLTLVVFLITTVETANSFETSSFLVETEIEEALDEEVQSCVIFKDLSIEKSSDGGNTILTFVKSIFGNLQFDFTASHNPKSNSLTSKVAYFILYCCIKVNY